MKKIVRVALQYTLDHDAASYGKLLQQTLVMVCSDFMFIQKAFLALILARMGEGEAKTSIQCLGDGDNTIFPLFSTYFS